MPRKAKPSAGGSGGRPWTAEEIATLRARYWNTTNRELAEILGRSIGSVRGQADALCLTKAHGHRAEQSRRTALRQVAADPGRMKALGELGGPAGGKSRALGLTVAERVAIARKGGHARKAALTPEERSAISHKSGAAAAAARAALKTSPSPRPSPPGRGKRRD